MFDAQILIRGSSNTSVFSPWFPREADNARFTLEVVSRTGSSDFKVEVFTKARDVAGTPGTAVGSAIAESATGIFTEEYLGNLNELVRFKFTAQGNSGEWVLFRMLPGVWFDSVDA